MADEINGPAFAAWRDYRTERGEPATIDTFRRSYVGLFASIEGYAEDLVDEYQLDVRLDAAIGHPFRPHVDIDVTALAQALVRDGALYAIPADPVGVWVFRAE